MSSFFIQGKGNSSGARVHPRTNRIVQKKKKEAAAAADTAFDNFMQATFIPYGVYKRSGELIDGITGLTQKIRKVKDDVTSIPEKVKEAVSSIPEKVIETVNKVKQDAEDYITENFDTDQLFDEINDWYSGIQTPDETANQIAQQNATAANNFTHEENRLAREWNEQMYNTRYQRTYADMKAAGINPVIGLASMGVGSVPSASGATGVSAQSYMREPNLLDQVIPVVRLITSLVSAVTKAKR